MKWFWKTFDRMQAAASLWGWLGLSSASGAITSIAAWAIGLHSAWWLVSFWSVVFLVIVSIYLASVCRDRWIDASVKRRFYESGDRFNPLQRVFENQRIHIADLLPPVNARVEGKTFINCDIIGPANVVFFGSNAGGCTGDLLDAVVARYDAPIPMNAMVFQHCNFESCRFFKLTFIVLENHYEHFIQVFGGLNWISLLPTYSKNGADTQIPQVPLNVEVGNQP